MNLPNILTLTRVIASFAVCLVLCANVKYSYLAALLLFIAAAITDYLDGYYARKRGLVTNFGKFMDALCDKIMILGIAVIMIALDMFENWNLFAAYCVFITVTREFFVSGIRMMAAKSGVVIAAEKLGKYKTAFQMVSLGSIILAKSFESDFLAKDTIIYGIAFYLGIFLLGLSTLLAAISGINYAVKYRKLFIE